MGGKHDLLWERDSQGNLKFGAKKRVAKARTRPDTLWNHPVFLVVVILLCATVDFMCFKQLFDSFLLDAPAIRWTTIFGMLFAFDFVPIYLGLNYRKRRQGYNVSAGMLAAMAAIFVLAFAVNVYLRIAFRDLVLPDLSQTSSSVFGSVSTGSAGSARALPYAIFASVVPLLTSVGSFAISYFMANPLRQEKLALDAERDELSDRIGQLDAVLQEYDADPDFQGRLKADDEEKYTAMRQLIREKRETYRDYVRERIKEHLGDPVANNILAKPLKEAS